MSNSWVFFALIVLFCLGFYCVGSINNDFNEEFKDSNSCSSEQSCLCRDKCEDIYKHSDWESWYYKKNGECWCIDINETKRIF